MSKTCEKCGHQNPPTAIYCENCKELLSVFGGAARRNDEPPPQQEEVYEAPPKVEEQSEKKGGKGCLTCGCIGLIVIVLLIGGMIGGGAFYANKVIEPYITETPIKITPYKATESEMTKVQKKVDAVKDGSSKVLFLTGNELNTLVAMNPDTAQLSENVYFYIIKDVMRIKGNIPIPVINKYLSGRIDVRAKTTGKDIAINIISIVLEKGTIPPESMNEIQRMNLYDQIKTNPQSSEAASQISAINIANGRLQIMYK